MELKNKIQLFHVMAALMFGASCYWTVLAKDSTDMIAIDSPEEDVTLETEDDHEEITSVFKPTNEWQIIKPGEAIPAGLHVRIDLSTGVREAKLMEEETVAEDDTKVGGDGEDHMMYWSEGDQQGIQHDKQKYFTHDELKNAMKLFKAKQDDVQDQEAKKKLGEKFRSIDELKRDFEAMDLNVETDLEVMMKLLDRYNRSEATVEEKATALHELEYYVHQIDNAKDLVTVGGLKLVLDALNSTEDTVRLEAAYVLGSAVQSNPHVQVQAVDSGALQLLLHTLGTSKPIPLRRKVMYATSSLLRMFPYAQERFLELGGLSTFSGLFQETDHAAVTLKVKAVTLLHDLLVEKKNTIEFDDPEDKVHQMRKQQYARVDLLSQILEQGWCELVPSLLEVPDNDTLEKVLHAMAFLMEPCQHFSKDQTVVHRLREMRTSLDNSIRGEESGSEDSFFNELASLVDNILGHIVS